MPMRLTPRERDILAGVASGATNKAIARRYGIKEQAVKNYLTAIYEKVGVTNRVALTVMALQNRLLDAQPGLDPDDSRRNSHG